MSHYDKALGKMQGADYIRSQEIGTSRSEGRSKGRPMSATPEHMESDALYQRAMKALDGLRANVEGCWSMEEGELRRLLGNTNYQAVRIMLDEAKSVLAEAKR